METETRNNYLNHMNIPRPFSFPRIVLARGAVAWFFSIIVILGIGSLLIFLAFNVTIETSHGEGLFSFIFIGLLLFAFVRAIMRFIEPFRIASLLKKGRVGVFSIIKQESVVSALSRFGQKTATAYTIRLGNTENSPKVVAKFRGVDSYKNDSTVLLYRSTKKLSPDSEEMPIPKDFLALDCFLHHKKLTLPDLLEGEEQKKAVDLYNLEANKTSSEKWKDSLGSTWSSLILRLIILLAVIAGIVGALFLYRLKMISG